MSQEANKNIISIRIDFYVPSDGNYKWAWSYSAHSGFSLARDPGDGFEPVEILQLGAAELDVIFEMYRALKLMVIR